MPFTKNDVTKSENGEWGMGLGNGTGEWDWGMGLGVGNGKVEWRVGHGELEMEYEMGN